VQPYVLDNRRLPSIPITRETWSLRLRNLTNDFNMVQTSDCVNRVQVGSSYKDPLRRWKSNEPLCMLHGPQRRRQIGWVAPDVEQVKSSSLQPSYRPKKRPSKLSHDAVLPTLEN
jgi:hypothetical protein